MIISISVAIIAAAFFVLVFYLVKTLKAVEGTLENVSKTLSGIENQLDGVTKETTLLLQKTNHLADDIQSKSDSLNTVVDAVTDVSITIHKFNDTLKNVTSSFDKQVEQNKDRISQVVQWSNVFLEIKEKWNLRKQGKKEEPSSQIDEKREMELKRLRSR
ncbi:MAG TPA: DUF948 domain-containing protein [Pseudoneobacillus sp.]|nr:DUF948 domain-containing protein [Pseudoneobacillus sp.]